MERESESSFWWSDFRDTLMDNGWVVFATLTGAAVLSVAVAIAASFFNLVVLRWTVALGSLGYGLMHLRLLMKRFAVFTATENWVYSAAIGFVLFIAIALALYLFSALGWAIPVAAVCAFLLPVTVQELWRLFGELPTTTPAVWYYTEDAPLQKSTTFLNSIPIQLRLHLDERRPAEKLSFQAPPRMKLATLLFHSVQEGHAQGRLPVNLTDAAERKIGWLFYTIGIAGQRRYLHPEKGLTENRIRRNSIIHAQRLSPPTDAAVLAKQLNQR